MITVSRTSVAIGVIKIIFHLLIRKKFVIIFAYLMKKNLILNSRLLLNRVRRGGA